MFLPDYFRDRAKKCLELAKRIHNPKLAQTFAQRARLLMETAKEAERSLALSNGADKPSTSVVVSRAKTLAALKRELLDLPNGMSLCVRLRDYSPDQRNEFWRASLDLSGDFRCSAEFRPDACLWFVKNE